MAWVLSVALQSTRVNLHLFKNCFFEINSFKDYPINHDTSHESDFLYTVGSKNLCRIVLLQYSMCVCVRLGCSAYHIKR